MTMRLGLLIAGTRPTVDALLVARDAELAGAHEIWVSEDYFENGAFALATAVAMATSESIIGLGVINPWTRHPMLTAMEFATLAELASGAILGLGASNRGWMQDRCGIPFQAPVTVLSEAAEIIRRALNGEHVAFTGQHFTVDAEFDTPADGIGEDLLRRQRCADAGHSRQTGGRCRAVDHVLTGVCALGARESRRRRRYLRLRLGGTRTAGA